MSYKFFEFAFTTAVKAAQTRYGSRQKYLRFEENGPSNDKITKRVAEFIAARDSFYMGTVSSGGWPYIQFRGGPQGFLKVLNESTLGFAEFQGNGQYISVGNISQSSKIFIFLMDYANRRRLKIWGHATVIDDDPKLFDRLIDPTYSAVVERAICIQVEAWDWNCPQYIPVRYSQSEVDNIVDGLKARIRELEVNKHIESPESLE
ncbi:MAG: pyridoxamine 5'-phosphate oxidase family protein [Nostoc sp.]|uniref:pyridoxamine 5'-phosphate oxidase family protein n=1 Tax=Nostoc sp. TaxID=1180 RepID=UPI002FFA631C